MKEKSVTSCHQPQVVFILLHGTFFPEAGWTKKGSDLRESLQKLATQDMRVEIERFQWTGIFFRFLNNGHKTRVDFGQRLRERVIEISKSQPDAEIFLLAHSHGGNTALYAWDESTSGVISGIACFSTPFIICEEKAHDNLFKSFLVIGHSILFAALIFTALCRFGIGSLPIPVDTAGKTLLVANVILTASLTLILLPFIRRRWNKVLQARRDLTMKRLHLPSIPPEKLFICGSSADEAAFALTIGDIISTLAGFFLTSKAAVIFGIAFGIFSIISHDSKITAFTRPYWSMVFDQNLELRLLGIVLGILCLVLAYAVASIAFVEYFLTLLRVVFYGPEYPSLHTEFTIRMSKVPPGVKRWRYFVSSERGLIHSRLYQDKNVLEEMNAWINERLLHLR